jgi:hypothetical protein
MPNWYKFPHGEFLADMAEYQRGLIDVIQFLARLILQNEELTS